MRAIVAVAFCLLEFLAGASVLALPWYERLELDGDEWVDVEIHEGWGLNGQPLIRRKAEGRRLIQWNGMGGECSGREVLYVSGAGVLLGMIVLLGGHPGGGFWRIARAACFFVACIGCSYVTRDLIVNANLRVYRAWPGVAQGMSYGIGVAAGFSAAAAAIGGVVAMGQNRRWARTWDAVFE